MKMRGFATAVLAALVLACSWTGAARACTTFVLDTPDGPVFGCNLDLFIPGDGLVFVNPRGLAKRGLSGGTTGEVAEWVSRYGSVTFNLAGREFAFGGMNEAGLVVGSMELRKSELPPPDERPPLTIGGWAQYVLDTCGSVEEAVQVNSRVRMEDAAPPVHFLIADAAGNCATVEWLDGECVIRTGEDVPVKAMTNMRYERALAAYERGGPRWWWSNPGESAERFAAAAERNRAYDPVRDGSPVDYAFGTLIEAVVAPHTRWSIVYDIPNREIWYGSRQSRAGKRIALEMFDYSCEDPPLMLDVNARLEGPVEGAFKPYDRTENLRVLRTLCDRYELDVSAEAAEAVVRVFDDFECAPEDP